VADTDPLFVTAPSAAVRADDRTARPIPESKPNVLRVLLVEDSRSDAELLINALSQGGYEVRAQRVETAEAMQAALEANQWDLVLSDYSMPAFSGPAALQVLGRTGLDLPLIMVSGTIGEEAAVAALKAGASDFLVKDRLARLVPAVERELRDVSLRRERARIQQELEEQLRHAQKMEAVGQLAGGVAHDFNNILTAILGYAELLADQIGPDKPIGKDLEEIVSAANRAATLTRQLLAFGRKQSLRPVAVSLKSAVSELLPMLRRLITENIAIRVTLDPTLPAVVADPIHLDQVLMNLVVNARDAMPHGGTITIATRNAVDADDDGVSGLDRAVRDYVVLTVADTGIGMTRDVLARIFEPFFTTKERGRGTGLGLAAVFGIVKQLHGAIRVTSEPGRGTTFAILLPKTSEEPEAAGVSDRRGAEVGTETVLLVEDESGVRRFVRTVLERHGYRVLEANSSEAAIASLAEHHGSLDLLLTDVMLPGRNGAHLATELRRTQPTLPVVFMSGYADPTLLKALPSGTNVLNKPFTAHALLTRVRSALTP
jgi:two-component system cell cycle sensor histidine kinase/response regulator CckA